jgi:hypothetical protein
MESFEADKKAEPSKARSMMAAESNDRFRLSRSGPPSHALERDSQK